MFCPEITSDSLLYFTRQGDSYMLRAYVGRLAGRSPWKQKDAITSGDFLRIYRPETVIDVAGEHLTVDDSRWRNIVAAHNTRLGIG